jgi:hypothetical protein
VSLEKTAQLHLETPKLQEDYLSKTNSILTENNGLYAPASNTDGQFLTDTCVSLP